MNPNETYYEDSKGRLVSEHLMRPIDKARDALVIEQFEQARQIRAQLEAFKTACFSDIKAFVSLSIEQYGIAKPDKWRGNINLQSFNGQYQIQVAVADFLSFDERLIAAKHLIDDCITRWTADSREEIRALINSAFEVDKEGRISTARVLGLRRLDIKDEQWQQAMTAIAESVQVVSSKEYIRFSERQPDGSYRQLTLDFSRI